MTVFDCFRETPYQFLEISRGNVYGNTIIEETTLNGIFKNRQSKIGQNIENSESSATLHTHPEDYPDGIDSIVGQGVRINGINYEITNATEGRNFDSGVVEHYTFTLERAEY